MGKIQQTTQKFQTVSAFTFKLTSIKTVVSFPNIKDILDVYFFLKKLLYILKTMVLLMHSRILAKEMILGEEGDISYWLFYMLQPCMCCLLCIPVQIQNYLLSTAWQLFSHVNSVPKSEHLTWNKRERTPRSCCWIYRVAMSNHPTISICNHYLFTSSHIQLMSSYISSSSILLTKICPSFIRPFLCTLGYILFHLYYNFIVGLLSKSFHHCSPSSWPKAALTFFAGMWFLRDVIKIASVAHLYDTLLTCWKNL